MVSSRDAERMSYLDYKVTAWGELVEFWKQWRVNHPDDTANADQQLAKCEPEWRKWRVKRDGPGVPRRRKQIQS